MFSSRALDPGWSGTVVVDGPADEHVRELAAGDGGDIGVHGSTTLARSLVRAGLVDLARTPAGTLLLHYRRAA